MTLIEITEAIRAKLNTEYFIKVTQSFVVKFNLVQITKISSYSADTNWVSDIDLVIAV